MRNIGSRPGSRKTAQNIIQPEMLISSPAQRAVQTARIFAAAFNIPRDAILTDMLIYTGSASDIIQVISHWNDAVSRVILFGHNPTVAELVMRLYPQFSGSFPTCSVCSLEFPGRTAGKNSRRHLRTSAFRTADAMRRD